MGEIIHQILNTENGELVILTRPEFDRLVRIISRNEEDAEDEAIFDARMADLEAGLDSRLPAPVTKLMMEGNSLLKALRLWKDETQMNVSVLTDLSQGFISDLENGRRTAAPETLRKIADALQIDPAWLTPVVGGKASDVPPPHNADPRGEAVLNYKSFNGRFVIGDGPDRFDTQWSEAGSNSVHIYNDPVTIRGVAIAGEAKEISDVTDAASYDFTSRSRTPAKGDVVILENMNRKFAALKIVSVQNTSRGALVDELRFEYVINSDGSRSFGHAH